MSAPTVSEPRMVELRIWGVAAAELKPGATQPPPLREVLHARWPVRRLFTYLLQRRSELGLAGVRELLATGALEEQWARHTWTPVALTDAEFAALAGTLPRVLPDDERGVRAGELVAMRLFVPPGSPAAAFREFGALPEAVAGRAEYDGFDFGEWGDVYVTPVSRDEVAALLADWAPDPTDASALALPARLGDVVPDYVVEFHAEAAREGDGWRLLPEYARVTWLGAKRRATRVERWYRSMLPFAAQRLGASLRLVMPRRSEPESWAPSRGAWSASS